MPSDHTATEQEWVENGSKVGRKWVKSGPVGEGKHISGIYQW